MNGDNLYRNEIDDVFWVPSMLQRIPLNPKILEWARVSRNLQIPEVAERMKKAPAVIEEWENGRTSPTYVQLEKLAYEVYKRPLAVFFFPAPPKEISPRNSFRTLPESELEELSPRFLLLFRQSQVMQANLEELNDGVNPARRKIFKDMSFNPSDKVQSIAQAVRQYLGISLAAQVRWRDADTAFKEWRKCVEAHGVFVFKDAFRQDDISGFCLYHDEFPVIYINNSMPFTRQIFTLFHELTHLLLRTSGIDKENDTFLRRIRGNNRKIEVLCNRFVGEFLVPSNDFAESLSGADVDPEIIRMLADRYKVSQEVILRKFLDRALISQEYYEQKSKEAIEAARGRRASARRGNYYFDKVAYLGENYLSLVFRRYYQNKFPVQQLAEYLNVKVSHVPDLEAVFLARGTAK